MRKTFEKVSFYNFLCDSVSYVEISKPYMYTKDLHLFPFRF